MIMDLDTILEHAVESPDNRLATRQRIFDLEEMLASLPGATYGDNPCCPLRHSFGGGIYMREIDIPAGTLLTGKIHRHDHPNVLTKGEVIVVTEHGGREHLAAPCAMISAAGTKRAVFAITDTHWITFHNVGNVRDLAQIEAMIIAPSYEDLDRPKELVI